MEQKNIYTHFFDKQCGEFINKLGEGVVTFSNNPISSDQLQAQKSNEEGRDLKTWLCGQSTK